MTQFETAKQEFSREIDTKVNKIINAYNNSKLKYNIYHKRASLILDIYYEQLLINMDYNSIPNNVIEELTSINMMSILLEQTTNGFSIGEVGYTIDGCLVYKDKVEEYNEQLNNFNYYNKKNLDIISLDDEANYEWHYLTDEELLVYENTANNVVIPEDAEKLVCQIELLRHAQPLSISLKLLEIRKVAQQKCGIKLRGKILENSTIEKELIRNDEKSSLIHGTIKNKIKNNYLIRKLQKKMKKKKF
ncbi:MAG: hypothetical protein IJA94_05745 [Bacilli bacterium]|nr:hypothetical protein [Bacilli bacterium]